MTQAELAVGNKFRHLLVTSVVSGKIVAYVCECGTSGESSIDPILRGKRVSCGCKRRKRAQINCAVCGVPFFPKIDSAKYCSQSCMGVDTGRRTLKSVDGVASTDHPLYEVWNGMKKRCYQPQSDSYARYGGRGIKVCDRWLNSFQDFCADMGPRPSPEYSIERKNNNGDYEPDNCKWATRQEQGSNKHNNFLIELNGESITLAEASRRSGVLEQTIKKRLSRGLSPEAALQEIIP